MKTNQNQYNICDFIIEQVAQWRDSNDIDSLALDYDLQNELDRITKEEGWLDKEQADKLSVLLIDTHYLITKLEENEND